ncbi:tRNA preQ1(34) S-adenosylmethionine ribosyltransferase-isomerase QueA [Candidatus Nitronereus thalassa]|uniref:S-adenosylmethionine:tRNA ribosyltransferase-isomerase n=1 Tax=Candidatus Nitronereus thalassa TaxID=3020898 RepID=A0ABU3K7M3_9BACT|nr:tRNA preQ1(34) S-adenosylmethionine ribosyltransferase-isomerase QueA [Candidatus Nitronereus thalassa]MDT7042406.1 tRNA preQ1(34) S-adenosylmethionine ribosyltransferase-isomerase QueA [Candidatus Nitronereus thalassa]
MLLSDFDVPFDETLIAEYPVSPRDQARLLVVPKNNGAFLHKQVRDLPSFLVPGDVLVLNDTKVIPARLRGIKLPSGGKVELLLVRSLGDTMWEVLLKGHVKEGQVLQFSEGASAIVRERGERTVVKFTLTGTMHDLLQRSGEIPLPPYIKRQVEKSDAETYQTVFARNEGAVAAPTAGLHFTEELLANLRKQHIHIINVTLHVGPGTFKPVIAKNVEDHRMDAEWYEVSDQAAESINTAKADGRRIVAVGTTAVRTLEASAVNDGLVYPGSGGTKLFIFPGYQFKIVDAMLTNFHFPRTTLIMLVSALAGQNQIRAAYQEAVKEKYRFYSYGDAMLIE